MTYIIEVVAFWEIISDHKQIDEVSQTASTAWQINARLMSCTEMWFLHLIKNKLIDQIMSLPDPMMDEIDSQYHMATLVHDEMFYFTKFNFLGVPTHHPNSPPCHDGHAQSRPLRKTPPAGNTPPRGHGLQGKYWFKTLRPSKKWLPVCKWQWNTSSWMKKLNY